MPSLRYFAQSEVQNGDSYCFLIVSSFHVLIIEASGTGLATACICVHDSVPSRMLISMQDCCFKHHIDIQLENLHAVKYVHPAKPSDSLTVNSSFLLEANTTLSGVHPPLCSWLFPACVTPHLEELLSQLAAQVATESISGCQCQWAVPIAVLAQEDTSSSESS